MIDPVEIAEALINARLEHSILEDFPGGEFPANQVEAHDVLDEIIIQFQLPIGGWKAAFTNEAGQKAMGVDGPACGPLFAPYIVPSPANLNLPAESWRGVEAEFGFRMSGNLPPRETPYTLEEVAAAAGTLHPAIEVVDSRVATGGAHGGVAVIADHCGNASFVHGAAIADWRALDLAAAKADVKVDGEVVASGSGAAVMGNPLNSLTWIANHLSSRGKGLKSGDWVTTGSTMGIFKAPPGSTVVADFGALGAVEVVFAN
jgi:2-keto-4-pentenoate hydratase